ncbi:MAG: aspartate carbamoyltransferase catalytic subunit [Acidobacteriales bacterium]|nr:aspartate carbamoyltransferase catalytic subunit [Terriglobales bacterium]
MPPRSKPKRAKAAPAPPFASAPGSLLDLEHLPTQDITDILKSARRLAKTPRDLLSKMLPGRRVALLFYEASTRTRVSFEFAAKNLGAVTSVVTASSSSIEKGESLTDTGITLEATGAEAIVIRHPSSGAASLMARHVSVPVLNAGDGMHEHPSQGLLDAYTILEHKKDLRGLRVVITGDIQHSRVARSNAHLLSRFGAKVTLCGPPALLPGSASALAPNLTLERDFARALRGADAVMMLRIQKERLAGFNLNVDEYIAGYQLTAERLRIARKDAIVMHPGPMIRGLELTADVADGPQSVIAEQVGNGVLVRMALLLRAFKA